MDVILATHDLAERQKAYKEVETIANEDGLVDMAADTRAEDSCE